MPSLSIFSFDNSRSDISQRLNTHFAWKFALNFSFFKIPTFRKYPLFSKSSYNYNIIQFPKKLNRILYQFFLLGCELNWPWNDQKLTLILNLNLAQFGQIEIDLMLKLDLAFLRTKWNMDTFRCEPIGTRHCSNKKRNRLSDLLKRPFESASQRCHLKCTQWYTQKFWNCDWSFLFNKGWKKFIKDFRDWLKMTY